jgi:hypothetical protein
VDTNGDGTLEPGEVQQTTFVCNGPPGPTGEAGAPGAPGDVSLFLLTNLPAGSQCPSGGVEIQVGLAPPGATTLEADEVQQTSVVCNGATADAGPELDIYGDCAVGTLGCDLSNVQPQLCTLNDSWVNFGPGCSGTLPKCLNGVCVACLPGTTQCVGADQMETCGASTWWEEPVSCPTVVNTNTNTNTNYNTDYVTTITNVYDASGNLISTSTDRVGNESTQVTTQVTQSESTLPCTNGACPASTGPTTSTSTSTSTSASYRTIYETVVEQ